MSTFGSVIELSSLDGTDGFRINGQAAGDYSGFSVASAGDVNSDGFADLIIGAYGANPIGTYSGATYVVFGSGSGFDATFELSDLDGTDGFKINGKSNYLTGDSVASAGDVNGDGFDDLIIGASRASPNGSRSGATYVVFGSGSAFDATLDLSNLDGTNGFQIGGEAVADYSGFSVASAGDVDGDGVDDLIIGARGADPNGGRSGASYVVFGTDSGFDATLELTDLDGTNGFQINGEAAFDYSGFSVASAGDVDGDGVDDLIIGARGADPNGGRSGASYVVFGTDSGFGSSLELSDLDGTNGFKINGEAAVDISGFSVASAGDVNGDGIDDLIIGAYGADPNGSVSGASYVVFGSASVFSASLELSALSGTNGFQINGDAAGDYSGRSVASAGDVNGDGFDDLIIGARWADPNGKCSGASYVVFGTALGFDAILELSDLDGSNGFQINGEAAYDFAGVSVASAGDVNGDGCDDLIVGANGADPNGNSSGASYVIFGRAPDEAVSRTGTNSANTIRGGAHDDTISGLSGDDMLYGAAGNDSLDGGAGNDALYGGEGDDIYVADSYDDTIIEQDDGGTDTVQTSATYTLDAYLENLTLTGSDAIDGTGNALDNILIGNEAANELTGGEGDDTYVADDADTIIEQDDGGTDTVQTSATYTLDAYLENLTLAGSDAIDGTGNALDNEIVGNEAANILYGGTGNDYLVTISAGGNDTLYGGEDVGGLDRDWLSIYNDEAVSVTFTGDETGTMTAVDGSDDTTALYVFYEIEDVIAGYGDDIIDASASASDHELWGYYGDDYLVGGSGNDTLRGQSGNDTLYGGAGNDSYVVYGNDTVLEDAEGGTDSVESRDNYTLGDYLENLTLTGSSAINATGNALNNTLTGNSAANTLNGETGTDVLVGGADDDIYVTDGGDTITEGSDAGTDTVQSSATATLGDNLENLTLTGTSALNGTGNTLNNTLTGNSASNNLNGGSGTDTLIGGNGNDTYVTDGGDTITEGSDAGTDTVQSSVDATLGDNLENLTLIGSLAINATGNALNNILTGNSAANSLSGGMGNDTYVVGANDTVTEASGSGTDTVQSSLTYTLGLNVENLTLTGSSAINGTGNTLNNTLTGNSAANTLSGGTGTDTDTLIGGTGNDIYLTDGGDTITEASDAGTDTVQSTATAILGLNVENLTLTGSSAINGTGNTLNNILTGNSAANALDGGTGDDTLVGGSGDDIYVTDGGDTITEGSDAGTDTVQSSATAILGANIENLTLTGSSAINATGNTLDNTLFGNSAANTINGGTGTDYLIGGAGNDIYVTDGGDVIFEAGGDGTDTVQSSNTHKLDLNVENLTLTGTSAINGTGNTLNNTLTGNSAANALNGGTGTDILVGGSGNDIYVTDGGDTITEASGTGSGTDTVQSSATYALGDNLENLTLTGTSAINGTGNTLNNTLTGNSAANSLDGGIGADTLNGGTGKDLLTGAAGNDTFIFNTVVESAITATTTDVIADFVIAQDKISLSGIDAFASSSTNDAFIWKGTDAFGSTTKGEVRYQKFDKPGTANDHTMVWIDNDADTDVEMAIRLTGLYSLSSSDVIL